MEKRRRKQKRDGRKEVLGKKKTYWVRRDDERVKI